MGKLIVFEGTDGTGKSTQYARACERLEAQNVRFEKIKFPQYDEPSSALDPIAEQKMYETMMASAEGKTVVFISHRMSACTLADRIVVLDHGRVLECGSHAELMKKNGRYSELFRMQSEHYIEGEAEEAC